LKEYQVEVVNDELVITDEVGELFEYNPKNKESQRIQETLFHEKQTIIENCLFGVDINQNSVKICRLRLWIELLKNAYYKSGTEELETLPNIDINIKCGNSLISRYALDADIKKALRNSKWSIESYRLAVMTYRNAQSKEEKRNMEKLINEIKNDFESEIRRVDKKLKELNKWKQQLLALTSEQLFDIEESKKKLWNSKVSDLTKKIDKREKEFEAIKNNIIYKNAFEWRFEFPEVLNDDGDFIGFDVVIGNPPWGASMSNEALTHVKTYNKDIIVRMVDAFMFFINLDFTIKSNNGYIAQIIPDVLLYQIDNEKLRIKILEKYQLILAVNLGDNIFEDVARASCIILICSTQDNLTNVFEFRKRHNVEIEDINKTMLKTEFFKSLPNTIFATRNIKGYSIISRYKESQLIELIDNDGIQRGISPDYKEAFIIDESIIKQNNLENSFIFPTLTGGRDTERYYSKDIGKQIIYTKKGDDESSIENIINYIEQFRNSITCKEVKQGKHPFWALHRARNPEIFNKETKILGVITGDKISVSLDDNFIYPTDGLFVFSSNGIYSNEFLVGLLNSKFMTYLYRLISMEEDRALAQIKPSVLELIPVSKTFNTEIVANIEDLTIKIINKVKNKNSSYLSETNEIDSLVYRLYDLSQEEIKIIEETVN